ncbi:MULTISPECIES: Hint domain-containing protein [Asaia]|uniref:Hint domain-containing protein n=1 Tax=Asaia TaxID=91914 RepID=UPI002FC2E7E3
MADYKGYPLNKEINLGLVKLDQHGFGLAKYWTSSQVPLGNVTFSLSRSNLIITTSSGISITVKSIYSSTPYYTASPMCLVVDTLGNSYLIATNYMIFSSSTKYYQDKSGWNSGSAVQFHSTTNGWDLTSYEACFLAGAKVNTPQGVKLIENIVSGDEVLVYDIEKKDFLTKEVVSTARGRVHSRWGMGGFPIRLVKDSISDGVPSEDLVVTSEHCFLLRGHFVPARMLVNEETIYYDKNYVTYDFYHISLPEHSVIIVNNCMTESWLKTENHIVSNIMDEDLIHQPDQQTWEKHAAAPLLTSQEFVEPIYNELYTRACTISGRNIVKSRNISRDPELHLESQDELKIYPSRINNNFFVFELPDNIDGVRIISKSDRPSDAIGPFVDDRRLLGVLVGKIKIFDSTQKINVADHLTIPNLSGWNGQEIGPVRWTDGNAFLPLLSDGVISSKRILAVEIVATGHYREDAC